MSAIVQYEIPQWVSTAFLFSIPAPFILIAALVQKEAKKLSNGILLPSLLVFFISYILYVYVASNQGWFKEVSLPPKVLLLATFPFALFLFGILINTKIYKTLLKSISLDSLVKLHIFRLIGVFFILLAMHDSLPKPFAFIAGFGDIATALTSIFVAKSIQNKKGYAKQLTYYWNIFGTLDILFTAIAANILTKISIDTGSMGVDVLAAFPFCLIPAFAPPMILFLHWSIFKKLSTFSI